MARKRRLTSKGANLGKKIKFVFGFGSAVSHLSINGYYLGDYQYEKKGYPVFDRTEKAHPVAYISKD